MIFRKNVRGSEESSRSVIVGEVNVYVHSNVKKIEYEDYTEYVYDEIQYTRQEWEQILSDAKAQTEDSLCQFDSDIEEIKDALCEIDERLEGGSNDE